MHQKIIASSTDIRTSQRPPALSNRVSLAIVFLLALMSLIKESCLSPSSSQPQFAMVSVLPGGLFLLSCLMQSTQVQAQRPEPVCLSPEVCELPDQDMLTCKFIDHQNKPDLVRDADLSSSDKSLFDDQDPLLAELRETREDHTDTFPKKTIDMLKAINNTALSERKITAQLEGLFQLGKYYQARGISAYATGLYMAVIRTLDTMGIDDPELARLACERVEEVEDDFIERLGSEPQDTFPYERNPDHPFTETFEAHHNSVASLRELSEDKIMKTPIRAPQPNQPDTLRDILHDIAVNHTDIFVDMWRQSETVLGKPSFQYSVEILGSSAKMLVSPLSNYEYAVLIAEGQDTHENRRYIQQVAELVYLKVMELGESRLKELGVPELNNLLDEHGPGNWFDDSGLVPKGISYAGQVPRAGLSPFGRLLPNGERVGGLLFTPQQMADLFSPDHTSDVAVSYGPSAVNQVRTVHGDASLHEDFIAKKTVYLDGDSSVPGVLQREHRATEQMRRCLDRFLPPIDDEYNDGKIIHAKYELTRMPDLMLENLALFYGIDALEPWDKIDALVDCDAISEAQGHHLKVLVSMSSFMRLKTDTHNRDQSSEVTFLRPQPDEEIRQLYESFETDGLFDIFYRLFPFTTEMKQFVELAESHQVEEAKAHLRNATFFDDSPLTRGRINRRINKLGAAISDFKEALRDDPDELTRIRLNNLLSITYGDLGDHENSHEYRLQNAVRRDNPDPYENTLYALEMIGDIANDGLLGAQDGVDWIRYATNAVSRIEDPEKRLEMEIAYLQTVGKFYIDTLGKLDKTHTGQQLTIGYIENFFNQANRLWQNSPWKDDIIKFGSVDFNRMIGKLLWGQRLKAAGKSVEADHYFQEGLDIANDFLVHKCHPRYGKEVSHHCHALCFNNMGMIYEEMGDFQKAETFYTKTRDTYRSYQGRKWSENIIIAQLNLARVHFLNGEIPGEVRKGTNLYNSVVLAIEDDRNLLTPRVFDELKKLGDYASEHYGTTEEDET